MSGEDLKGWLGEELVDESYDDESLMKPAFAMNDGRKAAESTAVQSPVEVSDDDEELSHQSTAFKTP